MSPSRFTSWRALLALGGALVLVGSSMHPAGEMREMLAHPRWLAGHGTAALGYLALAVGLALYRRSAEASGRTRWWAGAAAVMMALETLEMTVHTAAYVDRAALPAGAVHVGAATPVLLTHLWMATLIYPVTGVVVIGLVLAGMRERSLGSPWIGWLGIVGAVAHGAVMPLVFLMGWMQFGILFPMILFLALWFILAGVWPARPRVGQGFADAAVPAAR